MKCSHLLDRVFAFIGFCFGVFVLAAAYRVIQ